ncbi:MAG: META domain-containing protein [Gemmatimonadales bacterium]|nr:META domain-containing protein [Gemmatimonadales bacterium]
MRSTILPLLLSGAVAACAPSAAGGGEDEPAQVARGEVTGVEWSLVELNGAPAPLGAGDRPATLTLGDSARASGFGGCNRIAGSYELAGDSLRFGPLISTRMACDQGMELEQAYGAALEATRRFRVTAGLELLGADGVIARFRAGP